MTINDTSTGLDLVILEGLDFDLECESFNHSRHGAGSVIAVVGFKLPCCGVEYIKHLCVGCCNNAQTSTAPKHHWNSVNPCGKTFSPGNSAVKNVAYL